MKNDNSKTFASSTGQSTTAVNLEDGMQLMEDLAKKFWESSVTICYEMFKIGISVVPDEFAPRRRMTLVVSSDLFKAMMERVKNDKPLWKNDKLL